MRSALPRSVAFAALFGLLASLPLVAQSPALKRVALVVGNGAYTAPGIPSLSNPPNDANDVAAKLQGLGFSVTKLVNADLADMEKARVAFAAAAKGADIRVFYYAGHGLQSEDGSNWLLPVDAAVRESYELKTKAFSAQEILDGMQAAGAGVNVVILDACRDNPFRATSRSAGASRTAGATTSGSASSLAEFEPKSGVLRQRRR